MTRYFLVYLFAQGVNTHAYIKLYALFNRVRLKKKNTHKSLFSTTLVFAHHRHHHHHHYVFLVGFFDGRRVGDHHARRDHRDRGILPRPRGNSNDKVPTFFFTSQYSLVGVTRGCKGQSSTYFISIIFVVGRIGKSVAVSLQL